MVFHLNVKVRSENGEQNGEAASLLATISLQIKNSLLIYLFIQIRT